MAENLFPHLKWDQLWAATQETLYMTALSGVATFVLGIVLGLLAIVGFHWLQTLTYLVRRRLPADE